MESDRTLQQSDEERALAQARSQDAAGPPSQITGYQIERRLGQGAYGEVWVAVDRNTGRRVAIKFYNHRGGVDWSLLAREVEKLAFLFSDRHVVQLIDVGWEADPPYYVMEYLERGSLEDRIAQGAMPIAEAVDMFREVAIGLMQSHGKGVLHCDLKPANVLLGQDSKPRLADFGQSRLSHEQEPALGTLFYMAPEQADLQAVPDARWDVYALGALLHCMLTGQPPHRSEIAAAEIEQAGKLEDRLAAYRTLVVSAPRPTAHRRIPGMDRELADILDRCLEARPNRRYPNIQSVLGALEARALRRARRPLLVLGAIGPALLLGIVSLFAVNGFNAAVEESENIQVQAALETIQFASRFVAETVAEKVDGRWQSLEREASLPELREILESATGKALDEEPRQTLQSYTNQIAARMAHLKAASVVVYDARGTLLARSPYNGAVVDQNYAYRDYFHGLGQDQKPGTPGLKPITDVHLSNVFVATSTKRLVVSFSAPIWNGPRELPEHEVIGVLTMSVNLGEFAELSGDARHGTPPQLAVLVDTRSVSPLFHQHALTHGKGALLEHPRLAKHFDQSSSVAPLYLSPERTSQLEQMRFAQGFSELKSNPLAIGDANYEDVAGEVDSEFSGRWLAAAHPVFVEGRPAGIRDIGWSVVVQERYDNAVAPVNRLKQGLVRRGLIAAAVVVFILTGLWGFVMIGLNDASRSRIATALRRRAGVKSVSMTTGVTGTGTGSASGNSTGEPSATQSSQQRSASEGHTP